MKKYLIVILICTSFSLEAQNKSVVFSEVYYNSEFDEHIFNSPHHHGEFIEFFNTGDKDIDISGWWIDDYYNTTQKGGSFSFPDGTIIKAKGFLVVTYGQYSSGDIYGFPNVSANADNVIHHTNILLNNDGECLTLYDKYNSQVDVFAYNSEVWKGSTWSLWTIGESQSIQRISLGDLSQLSTPSEFTVDYITPFEVQASLFEEVDNGEFYQMNWTEVLTFDEDTTTVVGWSKSYVNEIGQSLQALNYDFENNKVIVSQSINDALGRPVLSALPTPVNQNHLGYIESFITNESNTEYTYADFDKSYDHSIHLGAGTGEANNPNPIGSQEGTLGYYYSEDSQLEGGVPNTSFPYTRVDYSQTTPGVVRRTTIAGEAHKLGMGHASESYSMTASEDELEQFLVFDADIEYKGLIKSISVNPDGKQMVSYVNRNGLAIASCLSGAGTKDDAPDFEYMVDPLLKYIDIHLPPGKTSFTITGGVLNQIVNLRNDYIASSSTRLSGSTVTGLPSGFYRLRGNDELSVSCSGTGYSNFAINVYDKAGRLKRSYTPKAIVENTPAVCTEYTYNAQGWLMQANSPEEGITNFKYRLDGSIRFSQNSKQLANSTFSYTEYDEFDRPKESGEYEENGNYTFAIVDPDNPSALPNAEDKKRSQQYYTWYGQDGNDYDQEFVDGAVSKTEHGDVTTWYSYAYDGKVDWIKRQYKNMVKSGTSTIDKTVTVNYTYDYFGNTTEVAYQKGSSEEFIHTYTYDKNQNLRSVSTSVYGEDPAIQAEYDYYLHGPLKNVTLANGLQDIDYYYTLNGQLKMINDPSNIGNDVFALSLEYFDNDYTTRAFNSYTIAGLNNSYGGNINMLRWKYNTNRTSDWDGEGKEWAYKVAYDSRNYLQEAVFGEISNNTFVANAAGNYLVSNLSYDANGNIITLNRNAYINSGSNAMDGLTYNYYDNSNQLAYIYDGASRDGLFGDIANQGASNYSYNSIGQLARDKASGHYFAYDVTGKTSTIYQDGNVLAEYSYDDTGFRSKKTVAGGFENWYVRDLSGNILAVYDNAGNVLEYPIYGANRLGIVHIVGEEALYAYEISDHLGNVRATITGDYISKLNLELNSPLIAAKDAIAQSSITLKPGFSTNGKDFTAIIDPDYAGGESEVETMGATDYYPFGWGMPGRQLTPSNQYRFGYQGQFAEKDEETGYNQFEARLYDSRLGRWLTTDPAGQYSSLYLGMGNSPFMRIDPDGRTDNNDWYLTPEGKEVQIAYAKGHIDGYTWLRSDKTTYPIGHVIVFSAGYDVPVDGSWGYSIADYLRRKEMFMKIGEKDFLGQYKSPILRWILFEESEMNFHILDRDEYWRVYGYKLGVLNAFWGYSDCVMSIAPSVQAPSVAPRGFGLKGGMVKSTSRPQLNSSWNSETPTFNQFQSIHKGSFGGYKGQGTGTKAAYAAYKQLYGQ